MQYQNTDEPRVTPSPADKPITECLLALNKLGYGPERCAEALATSICVLVDAQNLPMSFVYELCSYIVRQSTILINEPHDDDEPTHDER